MTLTVSPDLQIHSVNADQLLQIQTAWQGWSNNHFMQQPAWLLNAWKHLHQFEHGVDASALTCLQISCPQDIPRACGFWFRQYRHGLRWWRLVGSGDVCSDYVKPPCEPGFEHQAGELFGQWFTAQPSRLLEIPTAIEVDGHLADCPLWQSFFDTFRRNGWSIDSVEIESAWRTELPDSWSEFDNSLHKSRRRKARRAVKLLENQSYLYFTARTPEEILSYWDSFVLLHQKRRQFLNQPGCFANKDYEQFLKTAVVEMAGNNAAWFSILTHPDNSPLAIVLLFDSGGVCNLYQSGIDTDFLSAEPGHLVNTATIAECIRSGRQAIDFLRGDEPYKRGWLAERKPLFRTLLFPPNLLGRTISSAVKVQRSWRTWLGGVNRAQGNTPAIDEAENVSS